ncbi:MAG: YbjQ family protein, partial [Pyrinomonadaceae bacterium]
VCEAARIEASNRMAHHAREIGADAIIAMRYDATEFSDTTTEVLAYGTAVKLVDRRA